MLVLFLLPLIVQTVTAQQVTGLSFNIEKSELKLRVYPDGSVKQIYILKASVALPPGSLKDSKIDISLDYKSSYENTSSSSKAELSGTIKSPSLNVSNGKLFADIETKTSQKDNNVIATLSGTIMFKNETSEVTIKIDDASIRATNSSKALFHLELEAKGVKPSGTATGKVPSVDEINKELVAKGLDFIEIKSIGAMLEEGNKTKIVVSGVIDIDKMLEDAVAAGMPSTDAAKLKKLLETRLSIESETKLVLKAETTKTRIVFTLNYDSETEGDIAKAEKVYKEAVPLVDELVTALIRRVAQATGNQQLLQILLVSSMTGAKQTNLPVVAVPPTKSKAKIHIYNSGDKVVIEVYYEGPRQRITPSSGNPSTDAEKMLTLLSAQLVQLRSQLARLGLVLPGAEDLIPNQVEIEPATSNVKVSKTVATISELPALKIEIKQLAPPTTTPKAAKITSSSPTTTQPKTKTSTTGTTTTTQVTATKTSTAATATSTATTTAIGATTMKQSGKKISSIIVGSIIAAIVVIIAAILVAKRK